MLGELLASLSLEVPEGKQDMLVAFLQELLRWNRRINLTAITDPAEAVEKHLVDSMTLLPLLSGEERLLDLGSGGGFPCIPLKIVLDRLRVVSVDSVNKKISFQKQAVRSLGLKGIDPLHIRAEALMEKAGMAEGFDRIVSRAFTSLPGFAAYALPYLAPDGQIVAMKGAEGEAEYAESRNDLEAAGLSCVEIRSLVLPRSGSKRTLIVLQKADQG